MRGSGFADTQGGFGATMTKRKKMNGAETAAEVLVLSLAIASRFVSRKKARALEDAMAVAALAVQIGWLLKENVYERPEVKRFVRQRSKQVDAAVRKYAAKRASVFSRAA